MNNDKHTHIFIRISSANVHISVIDINEYSPTFLQPSYVTEVTMIFN